MKDWQAISKASEESNEAKDCAVKAVTAVSNLPYRVVHEAYSACGRRPRKGTPKSVTAKTLKLLQLQVEDVSDTFKCAKTVRSLERMLPDKGRFLISTSGHLLAAVNGEIIDWTQGRLHRILKVERVTF